MSTVLDSRALTLDTSRGMWQVEGRAGENVILTFQAVGQDAEQRRHYAYRHEFGRWVQLWGGGLWENRPGPQMLARATVSNTLHYRPLLELLTALLVKEAS
ncbi:hypothetical protein IMZ11_02785 [Microtetraspora sp. AC03309]|uniref:hypothetical protein n=1 Tax=Microtetraspora sp. AC03309 TaxID=2779376 RepID=UPI001E4C7C53|nr:hypothetical protein [Microtetraspora sp. AC03309]MCC5574566.1 hypothetical protein [Microtetraspora sp. AC03309]